MTETADPKGRRDERQDRLARALRENLRRRKQQARAQQPPSPPLPAPNPPPYKPRG